MKLLTGELPPQKGTVVAAGQARRPPAGPVRLRPVPRHRHGHHGQRAAVAGARGARAALRQADDDRRRRHAPRRARGHRRRRGRLHGRERRGDSARRASTSPRTLHERTMAELQGGQKVRVLLAQALFGHPRGAAARRADQPPRPRLDSLAARVPGALRRHADRHLARPPLPERRLHAHRRHRLPDDHHLHRRLRRHGAGEDADPLARRVRQRAAREEDRAAERLHRALRRRHPGEPGHVAAQGSRAAADHRAGALEHPAPVHQVHDEPAVGPHRARVQRRHQGVRRPDGRRRLQRHRQSRREDRAGRPQRPGQDDAAQGAARGRARPRRRRRATSTAARSAGATKCRSATSRRITPARSRRA